ncbi:MAG TPA: hypothetical protein PKD98_16940, partial [Anaerolineae bacterium]|nr:hypothetical protein [Anaerolineae bacterium]
ANIFKDRLYTVPAGTSPTEVLVDIAENEFGLTRIAVPEQFKDKVFQHMTEASVTDHLNQESGEGNPEAHRQGAVSLKQ